MSSLEICIVDQVPEICEVIQLELQQLNHVCHTHSDHQNAIEFIRENIENTEAFIIDWHLPSNTSRDLIHFVKAENIFTPIVTFVTFENPIETQEIYHIGSELIYQKPISMERVMGELNSFIQSKGNFSTNLKLSDLDSKYSQEFQEDFESADCEKIQFGRGGFTLNLGELNGFSPQYSTEVHFKFKNAEFIGQVETKWIEKDLDQKRTIVGCEWIYLDSNSQIYLNDFINKHKVQSYIPLMS